MTAVRAALFAVGAAIAGWGGYLLLDSGLDNIIPAVTWVVGGVIAHDAVLAPLTLAVVFTAGRLAPRWLAGPAAVALIVVGTVTVVAIPVLSGQGERTDNPTLLDRDYWGGWVLLVATAVVAVALAAWRRRTPPRRPAEEA